VVTVTAAERMAWSREMATTTVLPALLPLIDVRGRLVPIEGADRRADPRLLMLDVLGGVDFWVQTPTGLITIASRVQKYPLLAKGDRV
jgi:hypothetical protein